MLKVSLTQYLFVWTLDLQDIHTMDFEAHDRHIFRVTILNHFRERVVEVLSHRPSSALSHPAPRIILPIVLFPLISQKGRRGDSGCAGRCVGTTASGIEGSFLISRTSSVPDAHSNFF
jgi:hypothetical protein